MSYNASKNKAHDLREKYPAVRYEKYEMEWLPDKLCITFQYSIQGLDNFESTWEIPVTTTLIDIQNDDVVKKLVFSLGMVELLSYWKITCSPVILVNAGYLSVAQINWWKKLLVKGMGEYFYRNNIDIPEEELVTFKVSDRSNECKELMHAADTQKALKSSTGGIMIPVGGGKDSIVTLDILMHEFPNVKSYMINPKGANTQSALLANRDADSIVSVKRTFDAKMLDYNAKGFLNGHTPFSAIVAFSGVLSGYLNDCDTVVLSNESSANEATVAGTDVNHQYSKSYEFEHDFSFYLHTYISSELSYFSFLRPLSEYQIGKHFAKLTKYHSIFRSCNLGSKHNAWCNDCAKCLYVYVLLSAFLEKDAMMNIFHENLLERKDMKDMFESLIGIQEEKPFECVGSIDEINKAIIDAIKMHESMHWELPYLLSYYKTTQRYTSNQHRTNPYVCYYDRQHNLPSTFQAILEKEFDLPCID